MENRRSLALATLLVVHTLAAELPILRVLPLGDSITFGCGSDAAPPDWYACCLPTSGGWRAPLWSAVNGSGVNASVLLVGTESDGPSWVPVEQRSHEGHPGWTITGIAGLRSTWVALQPDVVLLSIGTNDVGQGHSNATIRADMVALLASLRDSLPSARLLVASILWMVDSDTPTFPATIAALNAELPALAAAVGGQFVDVNGATQMCQPVDSPTVTLCAVCNGPCGGYNPQACPPNGYSYVHPSGAGYDLMGGVWASALLPILDDVASQKQVMLGAVGASALASA